MASIPTRIQLLSLKTAAARINISQLRSASSSSLSTPTDDDKEELFRRLGNRQNSVLTEGDKGQLNKYNNDWMVRDNTNLMQITQCFFDTFVIESHGSTPTIESLPRKVVNCRTTPISTRSFLGSAILQLSKTWRRPTRREHWIGWRLSTGKR